MTLDNGVISIRRQSYNSDGGLPKPTYTEVFKSYYGSKVVGYSRYFTALTADGRIDLLVRMQRFAALTEDIAVLSPSMDDGTGGTYLIIQVQHMDDEDGLPVTDLSLRRTDGTGEPEQITDPVPSA